MILSLQRSFLQRFSRYEMSNVGCSFLIPVGVVSSCILQKAFEPEPKTRNRSRSSVSVRIYRRSEAFGSTLYTQTYGRTVRPLKLARRKLAKVFTVVLTRKIRRKNLRSDFDSMFEMSVQMFCDSQFYLYFFFSPPFGTYVNLNDITFDCRAKFFMNFCILFFHVV